MIADTMNTATIDDTADREKQLNYEEIGLFVLARTSRMFHVMDVV